MGNFGESGNKNAKKHNTMGTKTAEKTRHFALKCITNLKPLGNTGKIPKHTPNWEPEKPKFPQL